MTLKRKQLGLGTIIALAGIAIGGLTVHLQYRSAIMIEGSHKGATAAQLTSLDRRMDRHVTMCDSRMSGVVGELGEIRGTVNAIWRHLKNRHGQ